MLFKIMISYNYEVNSDGKLNLDVLLYDNM